MPPPPALPGRSGWPQTLPFEAEGDFDGQRALAEVRAAIRAERLQAGRPLDLRVDAVRPVDREDGLWRLDVTLPSKRRLQRWEGAFLFTGLRAEGVDWCGEVVEADLRAGALVVRGDPAQTPPTGILAARPMDFLRAPARLLEGDAFRPVLPRLARLLGLASGALQPPMDLHRERPHQPWTGHPAWTAGWAMVWGPPGTGKTHTLVEHVRLLLEHSDARVLVLSTTHQATDEVARRLAVAAPDAAIERLGAPRIRPYVEAGLSRLLPVGARQQEALLEAEARLEAARSPESRARARFALRRLRRGEVRLGQRLDDDHPRCVVTTLYAALQTVTREEMSLFHEHTRAPFTTVVLDEAGLVPRATAAAVGLLAARQVVLVGDPKQLSPICVAARSMEPRVKRWLGRSGMEHADLRQPATQALMQQRRMHPAISGVVSAFQYGNRLQDHQSVRQRDLPEALSPLSGWPRAAWVVLDACDGVAPHEVYARRGSRRSWERPAGVDVFARLLQRHPALRQARGLFISPYRGQAERAQALLRSRPDLATWSASTVHAQQGAEADVVVFDLVRHGGWLEPEWRRLVNVAMSRAKHQLLFIAAENELEQPWLLALVGGLTRCSVAESGALRRDAAPDAQPSLFAGTVDPVGARHDVAAEAPPTRARRDGVSLGDQIAQNRAARRALTEAQAQLLRRDLHDLGPRVVRGVAGSGKTIVLAHWAAQELHKHDRDATIVYGNTALVHHLRHLLGQAWRVVTGDPGATPPLDRVHFRHVGTLLQDLRREADLPPVAEAERYALEAQARALLDAPLPPRFGLLYLDEAQDLGHDTLALLLRLVVPDRGPEGAERLPVRIFYDNAQNIYGRSTPRWSEFGLDVRGRSTVLRESFRATRPAMELALDVLHHLSPLEDDPDLRALIKPRSGPPLLVHQPGRGWRADFCVVQGQSPEVRLHASRAEEHAALVRRVQAWLAEGVSPRDIRVLAPTRSRCDAATAALVAADVSAVHLRNRAFRPMEQRVVVTTPQSFKGYEAELVAVVGVDGFTTRAGALLTQALYVALTRARTCLWVSGVEVGKGAPSRRLIEALRGAVAQRPERGE